MSTTLTVDRIYDQPNLSGYAIDDIGWSPDGSLLTYLREADTGTELVAYDPREQVHRVLFDFSRLDSHGESVHADEAAAHNARSEGWHRRVQAAGYQSYSWFPDGERILVVEAGAAPSILHLATGLLVPVSRAGANIRDTSISPDGRFVSYVVGWDLYKKDLATGWEIPLTTGSSEVYRSATPDTMGDVLSGLGHWWSPDASQVAFLETDESGVPMFWYANLMAADGQNRPERFPQPGDNIPLMALKVLGPAGYRYIDTRAWAGSYLARVSWLPDSRHLALQMLSRDHKRLDLVIADSVTGITWTILTETDPYWINVADDLRFFADSRRFLWSSERDSYRYLYLYDIEGNELLQLTDGPEASVAVNQLDEAGGAVYYVVWPDPYTEAQLKRVRFTADEDCYSVLGSEQLTAAGASHFGHISPDFSYFADINSTAVRPPRLDLCDIEGKAVAALEANACEALEKYGLREFDFFSLPAAPLGIPSDAMPLQAKLLEPANIEEGKKYPVIVYIYGGPLPGGFGLARNVMNYWRPVPELWLQMMAQNGYGVFSLDNRGSNAAPRGHDWETPIYEQLGHVELQDQLVGVEHLKGLSWVDPDRIGIVGGSFGGFMTLNAMLRTHGAYSTGVVYAPVTNWREYDCVYTERYMNLPASNQAGYTETAIPQYGDQLAGDLLLMHGAADPNVHLQHSIQLINQLVQDGKKFQMMLYPKQEHMSFFGMGQSPARLWTRITDFFKEKL
ncbi:hypothetical protein EY643_17765 [Halioglobus maricola]|uniref:S9 family peptidase n=1 Tax=Halioglobus maricola TaxID=2601894 RepID=A0A5P9NNI0_9GAMM|nr:DPP IV N-terminal domain-containing protein [Halioglobus maricola]QFU77361.1 hypothetical protein EY643_17765 [Halioglobus maricola]